MIVKPHKTNLPGSYRCLFSCRMFYSPLPASPKGEE
jgi:hypothetical protein